MNIIFAVCSTTRTARRSIWEHIQVCVCCCSLATHHAPHVELVGAYMYTLRAVVYTADRP